MLDNIILDTEKHQYLRGAIEISIDREEKYQAIYYVSEEYIGECWR